MLLGFEVLLGVGKKSAGSSGRCGGKSSAGKSEMSAALIWGVRYCEEGCYEGDRAVFSKEKKGDSLGVTASCFLAGKVGTE